MAGHVKPKPHPDEGGSANIILYIGLGMVAIGLVITFVGLGDKGFKTLELKLIGPSLVGCGVFFALLRILFCTVPSCCSGWREVSEDGKVAGKDNTAVDITSASASKRSEVSAKGLHKTRTSGVINERRDTGVIHPMRPRPHIVSESDDNEPNKLRFVPKKSKNKESSEQHNTKDFEDNFSESFTATLSLEDLGAELRPRVSQLNNGIKSEEIVIKADMLKQKDAAASLEMYKL